MPAPPASAPGGEQTAAAAVDHEAQTPAVPAVIHASPTPEPTKWPTPLFKAVSVKRLPVSTKQLPFRGAVFRGGSHLRGFPSPSTKSVASGAQIASRATPTVYSGLNKPGIKASDNAAIVTPPDSTGAIGPNHYVELANSVVHVWDRSLNSVGSASLGTLFGDPGGPYCDPQIQWDQSAGRWLVSFLLCDLKSSLQGFVVGWSKTSDPHDFINGWCTYGYETDPLILDYDKLGHNSKYLIVGGNLYDVRDTSNPPFVGAGIAWFPLPANGTSTCPPQPNATTNTSALRDGDGQTLAFTPVPVNSLSNAANGYIISAYDPSNSSGPTIQARNKLAVWHIDSAGVLHQDPDIGVNQYAVPPNAPQPGTTAQIDVLDGRLTQAVGDPTTGICYPARP